MNENERQRRELEEIDPEEVSKQISLSEKLISISMLVLTVLVIAWNLWETYG